MARESQTYYFKTKEIKFNGQGL